MLLFLSLVAPVFSLIALGFAAAKAHYLEESAARVLSQFGYKVAMPALLFRAMTAVGDVPVSPLWLVAAYASGIATTWILATALSRIVLGRPAHDAPSIAMGACFSNGVMLGFPLILGAFGPEGATPMAFLATCETLLLWLVGTMHMEFVRRDGHPFSLQAVGGVFADVAKNPIIIGLIAGLVWRFSELTLPEPADKLINFLAQAAIPISLFGLGMALAAYEIKGQTASILLICALKLVIYPALAFYFATAVFGLPRIWAGALAVYVSMPVGVNAFLFASRYDRAVGSVSAAVTISTTVSVVTVTLMLAFLQQQGIILPP